MLRLERLGTRHGIVIALWGYRLSRSVVQVRGIFMASWVGLLLLTSCDSNSIETQRSASVDENIIRIASRRLPPGFANPAAHTGQPAVDIWPAFFDALTYINADGDVIPWLATGWTQLTDTRWRFELRDNVRFSNGEPFDADAVALAVNEILLGYGARDLVRTSLLPTVSSAEIIDSHTIDIVTAEPDPLLPKRLSQFYPLPPRYFAEVGPKTFARKPIGTGPFIVERWEAGRVLMRANRQSWRPPAAAGLYFIEIPEPIARRQAIESGQVQLAMYLAPEDITDLRQKDIEIRQAAEPRLRMLVFVVREGSPLESREVRLAMNHAIDKDSIVKYLLSGAGAVATQMGVRGSEGFDDTRQAIPYDPQKARALLLKAGYPKGIDLEMDLLVVTNTDRAVFEAILADLRDVGVRVKVNTMEFERWRTKLLTGDWQHDLFSFTVALDPLLDITKAWQYLTCERPNTPFCQPEVSALIDQRARTFDLGERDRLLQRAHDQMMVDPQVVLVHEMEQITGYRDLENLQVDNLMIRWDQIRKRTRSAYE